MATAQPSQILQETQNEKPIKRPSNRSWKSVTKAMENYNEGKYGKAIPRLLRHEDVEARAMFLLAIMYSKGHGLIQNMNTAASYLITLANYEGVRPDEEGYLALAHFYLGELYYRGLVFPTDHSKAEQHWKKGAVINKDLETGLYHFGTMKCQTALALFYSSSKLRKEKKAFYWHKRAAESGSNVSEGALGVIYMYGIGTEVDIQLAYNHLTNAAVLDNVYAKGYLAAFYYKRQMYHRAITIGCELDELEDYKTIAEITDCHVNHVKQGVAVGIFHLALCIQNGYAAEKDKSRAKELIKKALETSTSVAYELHVNAILGTV